MQQENLSAVNIEAASSWIATLGLFLHLLMNFPEFAAEHKLGKTSEILKYYFYLCEKQLRYKNHVNIISKMGLLFLSIQINFETFSSRFYYPVPNIEVSLKNHSVQLKKTHILQQKCPYTNKGSELIRKALSKSTRTLQWHNLSSW